MERPTVGKRRCINSQKHWLSCLNSGFSGKLIKLGEVVSCGADGLERGTGKEAEFHHESENTGEDDGEGSPGGRGAQALAQGFDEDD